MKLHCPECNSVKLRKFGMKWKANPKPRHHVQQWLCESCGRISIYPVKRSSFRIPRLRNLSTVWQSLLRSINPLFCRHRFLVISLYHVYRNSATIITYPLLHSSSRTRVSLPLHAKLAQLNRVALWTM